MINLIYGDDLEKIEEDIIKFSESKKLKRLDGAKLKIKVLEEELVGESLFGEENIVLIENIFKNKEKKELFKLININKENASVLIVERSKVNKRDLSNIKADKLSEYFLPQYYFKLLDDIYPKNGKRTAQLYSEVLKTMTAEQVFYSLVKRIRALIAIKTNNTSHSEIARFAPWQLGKLKQQASYWREEELISFYNSLYQIEKRMKTSSLPAPLDKYLDIMIITELN